MAQNSVPVTIRKYKKERALIFIHGFSGSAHQTFGMFPAFLAGEPALLDWDIFSFGYPTSLAPDITGVWSSDPDITALADLFKTALTDGVFSGYNEIAVIAHSMGGLLLQRTLLDGDFDARVKLVFLFGTPSMGAKNKASLLSIFKQQVKDMVPDGLFITKLRKDWTSRYANGHPFRLLAV